jgi:hypothetical protein
VVQGISGGGQKRSDQRYSRDATSDEVKKLKSENQQLKESLAEAILDTHACTGVGIYSAKKSASPAYESQAKRL